MEIISFDASVNLLHVRLLRIILDAYYYKGRLQDVRVVNWRVRR